MKRTFPLILSLVAIALAGSVYAQSDYGTTDPATAAAMDPASEQGTSDAPAQGSMYDTADPSSADQAPTHDESLPATASHLPLAFAIGVSALGAAAALRAYRLRSL